MHAKDKLIDSKISKAIIKASDEIVKGKLDENFPLFKLSWKDISKIQVEALNENCKKHNLSK